MALLEWHYAVAFVVGLACWLYSRIKTFQKQLNRRNNRIPDIKILRKIVPVSCNNGWKVKSVCNAFPVWYYSTTFTFAPRSLVATRTVLQGTSARILEELKDIKVFSMIFPDFPSFQRMVEKQSADKDTLIISNAFSSLSLSNILLTGQQSVLTFERYWSSSAEGSWLYVLPTVQLLSSKYGYWFCFLLQDLGNSTSLLHVISSYPDSVSFQTINKGISSCQVLIRDHIETMLREKTTQPPSSLLLPSPSTNETPKVKKRRSRASSNPLAVSDQSSPATPVSLNSSVEAIGRVEEPAVIQHTVQLEDVPMTLDSRKVKRKSESPSTSTDKINSSRQSLTTAGKTSKTTTPNTQGKSKTKPRKVRPAKTKKASVTDLAEKYPKLAPYVESIYESLKILHDIWEATESTEGWAFYHEKDGVVVHRKAATGEEGSFPADVCKGKTSMKVPLSYLMMYVKNLDHRPEYDGMYESGNIIEELGDSASSVVHLVFKNLFLVTGRDFCSLSAWRHIKGNLYGLMNKGIVHPDCPEIKSKVRGNIIVGGYVLEEVSSDPPVVDVMYAVCTNMNGNIPQKIVNKVLVDQPMSLASVREKVEARYRKNIPHEDPRFPNSADYVEAIRAQPSVYPTDMPDDEDKSDEDEDENEAVFDEPSPVNDIEVDVQLETGPFAMVGEPLVVAQDVSNVESAPPPSRTSSVPVDVPEKTDGVAIENGRLSTNDQTHYSNSPTINPMYTSDTMLSSGFDLKENHYSHSTDSLDLPSIAAEDDFQSDTENGDTESVGSQYSEDGSSNSYHSLDHPRDSQGHIDFAALAEQSVGGLEEEFFAAQKVDTNIKHHDSVEIHDQWMYRGTTKNVVIMRKTSAKQKIHCFLGRGIIKVLPVTVWEMIRQPTTRHVYDSMLKKIATIKQIDKRSRVLHMRHETQACFVKQARDFCVMTVETVKHQRYTLTGVSVDIPECPITSDCVRGRVFSSGWIIEPIMHKGKAASMVTYISQVDFGGRLPSRLVNFIAKRQPLAVAYLRTYLEDAER